MRVALFITCLADTLFPQTGRAVASLLERLGCEVTSRGRRPAAGRCTTTPATCARRSRWCAASCEAFSDAEVVVSPVGLVRGPGARALPARWPSRRGTRRSPRRPGRWRPACSSSPSCWSTGSGIEDVGAYFPHRVTYHPTCHSLRMLRIGDAPLRLLRAVRGIDLVELRHADECCGFGGTFAVKNADISTAMLADKLRHVLDTRRRGAAPPPTTRA